MTNGYDAHERARSALYALDASAGRDEWVRIAMAARAAGLHEEDFQAWSASAPNYAGANDCRRVWRSIKVDGTITANTLFYEARKAGWRDTAQGPHDAARTAQASDGPKPCVTLQAQAKSARDLAAIFESYPPATADHPYLVAKRGNAHGLRVVPPDDTLIIGGQQVTGWLAVPARSLDGTLRTVQFIPPTGVGKKLNAPGTSFHDGLFVVGDIAADGTVYVCEGIGQAWACGKADYNAAAVVTFGSGRMRAIAKLLRERFPAARIILVPDRGKETDAEDIAREIVGAWAELPADKPANYDANDYEADSGSDALANLLRAAKTPLMRYKLQSANDLQSAPPLRWLVRDVVPADSLVALFGPSGSGKTFVAFGMAAAIAEGSEWFGHRVMRAPVTYCALEGERGMGKRAKAWRVRNGRPLPENLRFITQALDLRDSNDVRDLANAVIAAGAQSGLIVVDTLNRAAPGADENASADMGTLIAACKKLQQRTNCAVLLVHHTGKDATKGLRGHSSLFAALDAAIEVTRTDNRREWAITKSKDGEDGGCYAFTLREIDVGEDDGAAVTSCVVERDDNAVVVERVKLPQGGNQRIALDALSEPLRESREFNKGDAPFGRPCLEIEAAVAIVAAHLTCEPKRRNERAREAITGLVNRRVCGAKDGWLWRK